MVWAKQLLGKELVALIQVRERATRVGGRDERGSVSRQLCRGRGRQRGRRIEDPGWWGAGKEEGGRGKKRTREGQSCGVVARAGQLPLIARSTLSSFLALTPTPYSHCQLRLYSA